MNALPADPTPNRMMTEVHFYSPYQFCLMWADESWGNMFYYWGQNNHSTMEPLRNSTWGEEDVIDSEFQKIKQKFYKISTNSFQPYSIKITVITIINFLNNDKFFFIRCAFELPVFFK